MQQKNDADIQKIFLNEHLQHSCAANQKASSKNRNFFFPKKWRISSKVMESFFQRELGSYTLKFPK